MAALADEGSAAGMPPDAVVARVGARVGLIADHPQNLRATFCNNLALFLDGRSVHPVLCVPDAVRALAWAASVMRRQLSMACSSIGCFGKVSPRKACSPEPK